MLIWDFIAQPPVLEYEKSVPVSGALAQAAWFAVATVYGGLAAFVFFRAVGDASAPLGIGQRLQNLFFGVALAAAAVSAPVAAFQRSMQAFSPEALTPSFVGWLSTVQLVTYAVTVAGIVAGIFSYYYQSKSGRFLERFSSFLELVGDLAGEISDAVVGEERLSVPHAAMHQAAGPEFLDLSPAGTCGSWTTPSAPGSFGDDGPGGQDQTAQVARPGGGLRHRAQRACAARGFAEGRLRPGDARARNGAAPGGTRRRRRAWPAWLGRGPGPRVGDRRWGRHERVARAAGVGAARLRGYGRRGAPTPAAGGGCTGRAWDLQGGPERLPPGRVQDPQLRRRRAAHSLGRAAVVPRSNALERGAGGQQRVVSQPASYYLHADG